MLPTGLHPVGLQQGATGAVDYVIPLVIQDRMFDTTGQLYFPNLGINPEHPYWIPEFVGDTIVVNGKVWPFLNVQAKRYRFLVVNGSNARTYELFFVNPKTKANGPAIWQIGTDGGYLDKPVKIDPALGQKLTLMPGERADIIVDFAGKQGQTLLLRNTGRTPYPKGDSAKRHNSWPDYAVPCAGGSCHRCQLQSGNIDTAATGYASTGQSCNRHACSGRGGRKDPSNDTQ